MAFVATNDQHGNEIMRVVLNTEPRGKRTVACCQNLRINCGPTDLRKGRFDHRLRFHYFADEQAKPKKTQRAVLSSSAQKLEPVTTQRAALSSSAQKLNEQLNKNEQQQQQLRRAKSSSGQKLQRANSDMSEAQQQQLQRWQREKLTELRQQRAERRLREQQQRERRQQRRELAADAWEQWAAEARHKPRPVPMGHGLDSLRGTQHAHYENPSKWQVAAPPPPQPAPAMQSTSTQTPTPRPRTGPDYKRIERLAQPRRMSKPPPLPAPPPPPQRERRRSLEPSPSIIAAICREQRSSSMECLQSRGNWRRRHKSPPANGEQQSKKALPNNFEYKRNLLCYKLRAWVDEGEALNRSAPKLLTTQQPQPQPAPPPAAEPQLKPPRKSAGCNATPMPTKRSGSDLHSKTPRKSKPWR